MTRGPARRGSSAFHQVQPGDNLAPSQPTTVLIGYDRRALYLAFRADDTSGHVRATLARRDAINDDDIVGVYLDTFHDRRRAYYIFFNPYGIQADGIYTEGKPDPDLTVDLVIDSKGTIDANGYTVEAAIPFASLRYQTIESGDVARVGAARAALHPARSQRADLVDAAVAQSIEPARSGRRARRIHRRRRGPPARDHPDRRDHGRARIGRGCGAWRQRELRDHADDERGVHGESGFRAGRGRSARADRQSAIPDLLRREASVLPRRASTRSRRPST